MGDIFISYSSKDKEEIDQICKLLTDKHISFFKAPESITGMSNYGREVPVAVKSCKQFLLFVSKYSQESPWVIKELECAINNKKDIIPVQISSTPLNDRFCFYLSNIEVIKYFENREDGIQAMLDKLNDSKETANEAALSSRESESAVQSDDVAKKRIVNPFLQDNTGLRSRTIEMTNGTASRDEYDSKMHRTLAMRNNVISDNHIPVECESCKGDLTKAGDGVFKCVKCGELAYDSFRKVRNYIEENGASPATQIANETGVPRVTVEKFLTGERLEIPVWSPITLSCAGCGTSIRSGIYCESCKLKQSLKPVQRENQAATYRFNRTNK